MYFSVIPKPYRFSYGAVGNRKKVLDQDCTRRNSSLTAELQYLIIVIMYDRYSGMFKHGTEMGLSHWEIKKKHR